MGEVYRARDTRLQRDVALKFVHAAASDGSVERLWREARAASALNHPHICTIYDVGDHHGQPFIAMECLEGETLRAAAARERLDPDRVIEVVLQIADGLDAAHASGIIHRDLKPANVFLTRRGDAKILDFGLAKSVSRLDEGETGDADAQLTDAGAAVGTLAYMAPEQARGQAVDARSDLFSFGVLLYELARPALRPSPRGRQPSRSTPSSTIANVRSGRSRPPSPTN